MVQIIVKDDNVIPEDVETFVPTAPIQAIE
jgi:hypothetical protein